MGVVCVVVVNVGVTDGDVTVIICVIVDGVAGGVDGVVFVVASRFHRWGMCCYCCCYC